MKNALISTSLLPSLSFRMCVCVYKATELMASSNGFYQFSL